MRSLGSEGTLVLTNKKAGLRTGTAMCMKKKVSN